MNCLACGKGNIRKAYTLVCGCKAHQKCINLQCSVHDTISSLKKKEESEVLENEQLARDIKKSIELSLQKEDCECAICFELYESHNNGVLFLPCLHKFGKNCIIASFKFDYITCPICRFEFSEYNLL